MLANNPLIMAKPHFPSHNDMRQPHLLLVLSTCLSCLITLPAFAQNADMTEEELSRMTGGDPLWVHITLVSRGQRLSRVWRNSVRKA